MVPRGRPNGLSSLCCRVPWCRAGGQMVSVLLVAASHGAARAAKWSQFSMLPRPMVPRGRPNGLSSLCCRVQWCRAGGQMVSVLCVPRPMLPRSSTCCRVPWCRAGGQMVSVLCVAASYGAARAAKWSQFSVLPRPMVPRGRPNGFKFSVLPRPMVPRVRPNGLSSLCCRVPWCRAVLHVAAFHAAAPRSLVPRSLRVAALHGAARGTTHRVFALLPRGVCDFYKRPARSTVSVSGSTAVVEVGRLRIDVEVSRSTAVVEHDRATVVVGNSWCNSIFDVGIKFDNRRRGFTRSSNQRSYWIVVWDLRHSFTHRLRIKSHRLHIRPRIVLVLPHSFYVRPRFVLELPRFVYVLPRISTYSRASKGPLWWILHFCYAG